MFSYTESEEIKAKSHFRFHIFVISKFCSMSRFDAEAKYEIFSPDIWPSVFSVTNKACYKPWMKTRVWAAETTHIFRVHGEIFVSIF